MKFPNKSARQDYILKQTIMQEGGVGGVTEWEDIAGKPEFSEVALTGSFEDLENIPDSFPPIIGTTSATAKAGDWTPAHEDLPLATISQRGAVKVAEYVDDASSEEELLGKFNDLLGSLRAAGILEA